MTTSNLAPEPEPARLCRDPECYDLGGHRSVAEPEQDGEHHFYQCLECGYAFGYRLVRTQDPAVSTEGTCAVGVAEPLRRAASAAMQHALAGPGQAPLLTIGVRPDASAT